MATLSNKMFKIYVKVGDKYKPTKTIKIKFIPIIESVGETEEFRFFPLRNMSKIHKFNLPAIDVIDSDVWQKMCEIARENAELTKWKKKLRTVTMWFFYLNAGSDTTCLRQVLAIRFDDLKVYAYLHPQIYRKILGQFSQVL